MVVVHDIRAAIKTFDTAAPVVDLRPAIELHVLLDILERWKRHPLWPKMVHALGSEYLHTVVTLAAASFLEDAGNGVVFQGTSTNRAADLLLVVGAQQRAAVEVKVPQVLRAPSETLGYERLSKVVEAAMKKAGTGTQGQLSRQNPAMLVIGGFHLQESDLDHLERAAADYLKRAAKARRHAHVIGIAALSFGTAVEAELRGTTAANVRASGTLAVRVATNPGYRGDLVLSAARSPTLRPPLC